MTARAKGDVLVADPGDEQGGDPPCWAHLFEEDAAEAVIGQETGEATLGVVDLAMLASVAGTSGVAWSLQSDDLNANLLVFGQDEGVGEHVNHEVDVLIVALAGEGILEIDGVRRPIRAGQAVVVAKGRGRSIRGASERFAYLTCHRRRAGLWPAPRLHATGA